MTRFCCPRLVSVTLAQLAMQTSEFVRAMGNWLAARIAASALTRARRDPGRRDADENWHCPSRKTTGLALTEELIAEVGRALQGQSRRAADMETGQGAPRSSAVFMTIRERFVRHKRWLMATLAA